MEKDNKNSQQFIYKDFISTALLNPLLNDFYQFTMVYAYWKNKRHNDNSSFDLFYRKNPFVSQYCIYQGIEEILYFLKYFEFTQEHIDYLKTVFPKETENEFFDYLKNMNMNDIKVQGYYGGNVVQPHEPLLTFTGSLAKTQLIETCLLNLVNYSTLISTLASEIRLRFPQKIIVQDFSEYGQSACGSFLGIKYSVGCGLIDYTTNLYAAKELSVPLFKKIEILNNQTIISDEELINEEIELLELEGIKIKTEVKKYFNKVSFNSIFKSLQYLSQGILNEENNIVFPILIKNTEDDINAFALLYIFSKFLEIKNRIILLINQEDVEYNSDFCELVINIKSNIDEKISCLTNTENELKSSKFFSYYTGIFYHFSMIKSEFITLDKKETNLKLQSSCYKLMKNSLEEQQCFLFDDSFINKIDKKEIDPSFFDLLFLGPSFIVSQSKPALGVVYKLMETNGRPNMKFSAEKSKSTIPGVKYVVRLFQNSELNGKLIKKVLGDVLCSKNEISNILCSKELDLL